MLIPEQLTVADVDELYQAFEERGWSDGLPIIPPTRERVDAFIAASGRPGGEEIALLPPRLAVATVESVAINAVMAGCRPEYMSLLVAILGAMVREDFNLVGMQVTTHPAAPLIVVSGEGARRLEIHAGSGALGPGWRANATIGRATRLVLMNVGGARPGTGDKATQGNPAKFTYCVGENEVECPWEPYRMSKGFRLDQSVVTVGAGLEGPHNINDHASSSAEELLTTIAFTMTAGGNNQLYAMGSDPFLLLGPEHAQQLARDGFSRHDVQDFLFEKARTPIDRVGSGQWTYARKRHLINPLYEELGLGAEDLASIPMLSRPEDLNVVVVGGPGKHSCYAPGAGGRRSVTVPF